MSESRENLQPSSYTFYRRLTSTNKHFEIDLTTSRQQAFYPSSNLHVYLLPWHLLLLRPHPLRSSLRTLLHSTAGDICRVKRKTHAMSCADLFDSGRRVREWIEVPFMCEASARNLEEQEEEGGGWRVKVMSEVG